MPTKNVRRQFLWDLRETLPRGIAVLFEYICHSGAGKLPKLVVVKKWIVEFFGSIHIVFGDVFSEQHRRIAHNRNAAGLCALPG